MLLPEPFCGLDQAILAFPTPDLHPGEGGGCHLKESLSGSQLGIAIVGRPSRSPPGGRPLHGGLDGGEDGRLEAGEPLGREVGREEGGERAREPASVEGGGDRGADERAEKAWLRGDGTAC